MAKNGDFRFLLLELILADQLAYLSPSIDIWWPRVALTWEDLVADQLADLPPCIDIWWPRVELTSADQVADLLPW